MSKQKKTNVVVKDTDITKVIEKGDTIEKSWNRPRRPPEVPPHLALSNDTGGGGKGDSGKGDSGKGDSGKGDSEKKS